MWVHQLDGAVANREGWIQPELKYGREPGAFGSYQMEPGQGFSGVTALSMHGQHWRRVERNRAECKLANVVARRYTDKGAGEDLVSWTLSD
jgi:hypothetical protein